MSKITLALLAALSLAALTSTTCGFSDEEPGYSGQQTNKGASSGSGSSSPSGGGSNTVAPKCTSKETVDDLTQFCWGSVVYDRCGGEIYDPSEYFCSGNKFYLLCDKKEYDPAKQICFREGNSEKLYHRCGSKSYDNEREFCFNNSEVFLRCNGDMYNPSEQFCFPNSSKTQDSLYYMCGDLSYNPDRQFCYRLKVYERCTDEDGKEENYDPNEQRCFENKLYSKCGSYYCRGSLVYDICAESKMYDTSKDFCRNGNVYGLCGDNPAHDPLTKFCHNGNLIDFCPVKVGPDDFGRYTTVDTKYNPDTHFCEVDHLAPLVFNQQCADGIPPEKCCFGKEFDNTRQFCEGSNQELYDFCGDSKERHDVFKQGCFKGKLYPHCTSDPGTTGECVHGNGLLRCKQLGGGASYVIDPLPGMTCNPDGSITGKVKDTQPGAAGREYKIAQIGNQIWLAEDLKLETTKGSDCYWDSGSDSKINCKNYGRLYDWETAINESGKCNSERCQSSLLRQGSCPSSFGIPKTADWNTLIEYAGGATVAGGRLKSKSGWRDGSANGNGTDVYGFNALPGGYYTSLITPDPGTNYIEHDGGWYKDLGYRAMWWVDNDYSPSEAYYATIISSDTEVRTNFQQKGAYKASVRCVHYY